MKLILIRHGETEESKRGILLGHFPGKLTIKGKKEMSIFAEKIKRTRMNPEIIFSSDLKRAKDSSKIIAKKLELVIKYNKLLRERRSGIAEGKKENEINWEEYEKNPLLKRKHKGGESFMDVKKRVIKFLRYIESTKYRTIILVSHSAFLSILISYTKKLNVEKSLKIKFPGIIHVLNIKNNGVKRIPPHLKN